MGNKFSQILDCIDLSQASYSKIRSNLFWALGYNVFSIPLAAGLALPIWGIYLDPSQAGLMMAASSLVVVGNSILLRAKKFKSSKLQINND